MIDTIITKIEQLNKGYFTIGDGPEILLLVGSCRSVPYLNYFDYLNHNHKFTVHFIDPFNWHWDERGNLLQDYESKINSLENDLRLLALFPKVTWFLHEHYENYGMFNTDKTKPITIYQFCLQPKVDVTIPNFRDKFILFQDIVSFNKAIRDKAVREGPLSVALQDEIKGIGLANIEKFCEICALTDLPEMATLFRSSWRVVRFFQTMNHISNRFSEAIFQLLNDKFLHLEAPTSFWDRIRREDLYASPCTRVTQYDVDNYGINWGCPIEPLKL